MVFKGYEKYGFLIGNYAFGGHTKNLVEKLIKYKHILYCANLKKQIKELKT